MSDIEQQPGSDQPRPDQPGPETQEGAELLPEVPAGAVGTTAVTGSDSNAVNEESTTVDGENDAEDGVEDGVEDGHPEGGDEGEAVGEVRKAGGSESPLESEAEIAADYLEELLDIADLDGDIDTYIEGDRAHVSIVSETNILVGSQGEVLDALQELTRLAVMTETGDRSRLMLDIAGFRDRRRQQLVTIASDAVHEVKGSSAPVSLTPMNPFERKIVHDAVAAAGLRSESEGEDPRRHVVVLPSA
jgi:spoIIIJ-associated protein